MKVRDDGYWMSFQADAAADPNPLALMLRDFTVDWADHAAVFCPGHTATPMTPLAALQSTLRLTETNTGIRATVGLIGGALALLIIHWEFGEMLYDDMTPIEQTLVRDTFKLKLDQLAAQAEEVGNG